MGSQWRVEVVDDAASLGPHLPAWDELAVACARPFCAPGWMLAWWRHAAPPGSLLRVVVVLDGEELVAVGPFWADRTRRGLSAYRLLGAGTSYRTEPLARAGHDLRAGELMAAALAGAEPRPDVVRFEGIPSGSPWPAALAGGWPARGSSPPRVVRELTMPAPVLVLAGRTYDEWLAASSRNFRQQLGRRRRRLLERGARLALASTAQEAAEAVAALAALHHRRWEDRGGSGVLNARVEAMLADAAEHLGVGDRLRVWSVVTDGKIVSSHLFLAAGGEVAYWLGGFDPAWADLAPAMQCIQAAAEHAWQVGDRRLDLGGGGQHYKYRFADTEDVLEWRTLVAPGPRAAIVHLRLAPERARRWLGRRLPEPAKRALRAVRSGRGSAWRPGSRRPAAGSDGGGDTGPMS